MNTNKAIVNKAGAITTSVVSSGLLQPYQAKKFLQQTFDATPLMQAIRHEVRTEKSGEIDKIGIGKRKLRGKELLVHIRRTCSKSSRERNRRSRLNLHLPGQRQQQAKPKSI